MIKVNGKIYRATINYIAVEDNADLEAVVSDELESGDLLEIQNATVVEEVADNYGAPGETVAAYNIVGWRSVTRTVRGTRFRWQTYRTTDLEALRQENEDLTQALLELAEIIGGTENDG